MASVNTLEYLLQKYEMGDTLGTGAFSDVKVATERATGNKFAIKIVDKTKCKGKESMIETEVSILMRVKHENIVQLYEMYEIENKIYLVMELVTGGELFDEIVGRGKYSEVDAAKIVYRILLAINYLHGLGIAHRDLKPENLLLSDKTKDAKIMISDFGLSKIFNDDEVMRTACGTPGYVAPEVLRRQGYGREIDLWSLGVITYILLCGYPPFYDQNNVELFKQIMTGKYEFDKPWWDNISENAKDFIRKLLVLDPHARSTARTALSHPFILEHCGRNSVHQALPQKTAPRPNASTLANQHEQYQQQQQLLHHQQQQQQLLQQQQQQQQNLQLQQKQQQEYYNAQYHQQQVQFQQQQHYAQYQQQQQQQQQQQLQQQQQQQDSATQQPQHGYIYIRDTVSRARRTRPNAEDDQHAQSADDYLKQHQQESGSQAVVDPGRPLGNKTRLDDSGCVTSNEQVNRSSVAQSTSSNNAKWAWKKWF